MNASSTTKLMERGRRHFQSRQFPLVKSANPQTSIWAVFLGSSTAVNSPLAAASSGAFRWSWLVRGLTCRQCCGPSCWCCCCARETLTSTKCCMSAHGCSVPCSPSWFPMGFQIYVTVLDLFQTAFWHWGLPGTAGGARASNPQMAVLPKQTERSTKKGKIHLCQHISFPWLGQGCGRKAMGATADSPLQG